MSTSLHPLDSSPSLLLSFPFPYLRQQEFSDKTKNELKKRGRKGMEREGQRKRNGARLGFDDCEEDDIVLSKREFLSSSVAEGTNGLISSPAWGVF